MGSLVGEGAPVTKAASQWWLYEAPLHTAAGPVLGIVQPDVPYACAYMHTVFHVCIVVCMCMYIFASSQEGSSVSYVSALRIAPRCSKYAFADTLATLLTVTMRA